MAARAGLSVGVADRASCLGVPDLGDTLFGPGGEIDRGIQVTIERGAARVAIEHSLVQSQISAGATAGGACFRRRVPMLRSHQFTAAPLLFIGE